MRRPATSTVRHLAAAFAVLALPLVAGVGWDSGPQPGGCYAIGVDSPTTGQHPTVYVCPPV